MHVRVGATELNRVLANRGHAPGIFVGGLERSEKSVTHFRGPLERGAVDSHSVLPAVNTVVPRGVTGG